LDDIFAIICVVLAIVAIALPFASTGRAGPSDGY
jgi:hypothetical protein